MTDRADRLKLTLTAIVDDVKSLRRRVSSVEALRVLPRDGEPGEPGAIGPPGEPGAIGPPGEPGAIGRQGEPGQPGRDGRDGPQGASVTRVAVEKDNRLAVWIGDVKTLAGRIVAQQGEQGPTGPQGPEGPTGPAGKDGASITGVKLEGSNLFIWLDGVKKKAGQLTFPSLGAGGGGGGSRRQTHWIVRRVTEDSAVNAGEVVLVDATAGDIRLTLSEGPPNSEITIKRIAGSGRVIIGAVVDGVQDLELGFNQSAAHLIYNSPSWWII